MISSGTQAWGLHLHNNQKNIQINSGKDSSGVPSEGLGSLNHMAAPRLNQKYQGESYCVSDFRDLAIVRLMIITGIIPTRTIIKAAPADSANRSSEAYLYT
jgi:hypothetical protein